MVIGPGNGILSLTHLNTPDIQTILYASIPCLRSPYREKLYLRKYTGDLLAQAKPIARGKKPAKTPTSSQAAINGGTGTKDKPK